MKKTLCMFAVCAAFTASPALAQNEFEDALSALAKGQFAEIASNPVVLDAVTLQNSQTKDYDQAEIDRLDQQWRSEVGSSPAPLIDDLLGRAASAYLAEVQETSEGLITEIFAMDAKGLNVAQSSITSDYWQGDEEKWQGSFGAGADAVVIGEIEEDESTQTFQSQVSITVVDQNGNPIGAMTFGVNVENL